MEHSDARVSTLLSELLVVGKLLTRLDLEEVPQQAHAAVGREGWQTFVEVDVAHCGALVL